jgi:hypothetical protein
MHHLSDKQLAANRANAILSRGPNTVEGKKKSSMNALRHGITAQTTVMTEEDRIKHDEFCGKMIAHLAPVEEMEIFLASSVAEEAWRLNLARAECNNIVAIGHFDGTGDAYETEHPEIHTAITSATVVRDKAKTLELLSLYEQRIHRSFQKHFAQLKEQQAERKAKHDTDLDNARLLSQLAELQNLPFDPAVDGIVFSNEEIDRYTERFHRLELAKYRSPGYQKHIKLFDLPLICDLPKQVHELPEQVHELPKQAA